VRDWLYVDDHVEALWLILEKGKMGEVYDISAKCEMKNRDFLSLIIDKLSSFTGEEYHSLITFVADRPGHDFRYAIDPSKIQKELGWTAEHSLEKGLEKTILWTLEQFPTKIHPYVRFEKDHLHHPSATQIDAFP
jgi:dTDP-glucose 4,6-dehydratase